MKIPDKNKKIKVSDIALVNAITRVMEECDADTLASIAEHVLGGKIRAIDDLTYEVTKTKTYGGGLFFD